MTDRVPGEIDLRDRRVVVMGLGRFGGGVGAARYCAAAGADVLVTDTLSESDLAESLQRLAGLGVGYRLGGHDEADFRGADIVVVNPAVPSGGNRYLEAASAGGARLTSEIELLIGRIGGRHRVIGVTGTAGKSTTTAMIGHAAGAALGADHVHVGGNLGGSLLETVEAIGPDDQVVLELSSFMLERLSGWSPHIAVVTNVSANHLDRHGTMEAYAAAKRGILRWQQTGDVAVLGPSVASWADDTAAEALIVRDGLDADLAVPGDHNRLNAAMAVAACGAIGIAAADAAGALATFGGLPHRMNLVAESGGVRYYDDSKSTTPEAALLALGCFEPRRAHMILGGYDKGTPLDGLAREVATRAAGVYTIGATGDAIADAVDRRDDGIAAERCGGLGAAVRAAVSRARSGDSVVLSPGCASWDQFDNYEQRGRLFCDHVLRYTAGR